MHSFRVHVENPWNLFAVDENLPKTPSLNKFSNVCFTNSTQNFEKFLSNKVPVSFSGKQNVICCNICKVLVVKNRYKAHYDNRHNLCNSKKNMIPFEDEILLTDKIYKSKKIKRSKKKRSDIKTKIEYDNKSLTKKKAKKIKVKSPSKRFYSKSIFDEIKYEKKLKCEFIDKLIDKKHFSIRTEEDFLSSPKQMEDSFYQEKLIANKSYNPLSINDGLCYSNDSVHRTSSDSSTPPSLSLGTLQTLSSPSSLNILNDLSSVITEHYLLPSNDLNAERSGISCKYQIDSLPWENLPPVSNKIYSTGNLYSKDKESFNEISLIEEDGEIERAVQSITGFYECLPDEFEISNQISFEIPNDGCKSILIKPEVMSSSEDNITELKPDIFTADDATVIDCFLDEINIHSNDKDHLSDNCPIIGNSIQMNNGMNQNAVDMFMDDCNNISEYQIDSNLPNIFSSDYDEKFENLINNAMNEFVTQSPQIETIDNGKYDRKKCGGKSVQSRSFDPLKHCGVIGPNGRFCYRSLLCKLHTMPQKRQVERSENITSLIKGIRDCNKIKKLNKKSLQASVDSKSSCSKMSCDSFLYNCSSNKSLEEMPSLLDKNLTNIVSEESVFNCFDNNSNIHNFTSSNIYEPQPLAIQRFDHEVIVNCNTPLIANKSLVWKNRPKSQCDSELLGRFLSNQSDSLEKYTSIKQSVSTYQDLIIGDVFNSPAIVDASGKNVLATANINDFPFDQFCSSFGTNQGYFENKYSSNGTTDIRDCQITSISNGNFHNIASCTSSGLFNDASNTVNLTNNITQFNNSKIIPFNHDGISTNNTCLHPGETTLLSNNTNSISTMKNIGSISLQKCQITSPGSYNNCKNQLLNVSYQNSNNADICLTDSSNNNTVSFSDQNSIINTSNQNTTLWNSVYSESYSNNNKFISVTDDRSGTAQMLYPVRNNSQIMMVMNKNQKTVNDQVDLSNDNFSFSVNQSIPINSLLTLKQNNQMSTSQRNVNIHQQQTTPVPTQQIVSISPLELQRLTDGLCTNNNQIINADCVNKSNEIFINPSKISDKKSQILYQINQNQSTGQFISSTLSSKIDSNNLPKPLTVQSSTPNGVTHRFVILPDGTISAFTQQSNNIKTNLNSQQIINRTNLQHPLFSQLSNCGQNQGCFLNGDKLIIAPNQVTSNTLSQQIIMPQIINQTELNNQSASRFTLVHQQPKLNNETQKHNYNRLQSQSNISNQVPIDSSHQKLSFHIQTANQYPNHTPNTFFLTAAPSGNSNIPLKQQIFLQSNDQITSDFSLIDSSKFVEGQLNAQRKSIHQFENIQCSSDVRTINSSNQDFEFLNHVINPQSIIIQQPPVNRLPNQSLSQLSNTNIVQNNFVTQTSQDINCGIDGAHSNVLNNNQHIVINNCSNEKFAQSQLNLSQRQLSTPFSNASNCNSVVVNQNQSSFKSVPPPLVISQQLLNQSVSNQFGNKSFVDVPFQQQSQQKTSHISQVTLDENQFSNEFVIMQSMIA